MGFKPTITKFRSETLIDWVVKAWVWLAIRFNFCHCLRQSPDLSSSKSWADNYMTVVKWIDRYGIHYWTIFRTSYRKLACVGFGSATTEFCPDVPTDWDIMLWVRPALKANFVQLLKFHFSFSVQTSFWPFPSSVLRLIWMEFFHR